MTTTADKFGEWCILEIMGHQRYAGFVSEQAIGGSSFVRIDVPEVDGLPAFSKCFGAGSIYCITPVAEAIARDLVKKLRQVPMSIYDLPVAARERLYGPHDDGDDD
jgi:hypothetical protein